MILEQMADQRRALGVGPRESIGRGQAAEVIEHGHLDRERSVQSKENYAYAPPAWKAPFRFMPLSASERVL